MDAGILALVGTFGLPVITMILTGIAGAISPHIYDFLKLSAADKRRAYLNDAIHNALAYGVSVAAKKPDAQDLVSAKDDVIATAKIYLQSLTPEVLTKLGVGSDEQLTQLIESRFASTFDWLGDLLVKLAGGAPAPSVADIVKQGAEVVAGVIEAPAANT